MAYWSTAIFLLWLCDCGKHAKMVVLTGCYNHLSRSVEKSRIYRERMLVFMYTIETSRKLFSLMKMRLPRLREFPNVPQFNRSCQRSRQNIGFWWMNIDLFNWVARNCLLCWLSLCVPGSKILFCHSSHQLSKSLYSSHSLEGTTHCWDSRGRNARNLEKERNGVRRCPHQRSYRV